VEKRKICQKAKNQIWTPAIGEEKNRGSGEWGIAYKARLRHAAQLMFWGFSHQEGGGRRCIVTWSWDRAKDVGLCCEEEVDLEVILEQRDGRDSKMGLKKSRRNAGLVQARKVQTVACGRGT